GRCPVIRSFLLALAFGCAVSGAAHADLLYTSRACGNTPCRLTPGGYTGLSAVCIFPGGSIIPAYGFMIDDVKRSFAIEPSPAGLRSTRPAPWLPTGAILVSGRFTVPPH